MKIAVVGPSPIPYMYGGAEKLMLDLCVNINAHTSHQCELIKIPVDEFSFWGLIECYHKFYVTDLSQFDMIITSKYPGWMIPHSNSVCWLMHTLRGLYDTYPTTLSNDVPRNNASINTILDYMISTPDAKNLDELFSMIFALRDNNDIPNSYFAFPGPFIRALLHYMDNYGLHKQKRLFAISNTVKLRKDYFPIQSTVHAVYPPVERFETISGASDYFFVCSRLDAPKRFDQLINSYKNCKTNKQLLIAGKGPLQAQLEQLAATDKRIQLLGFVSDDKKQQLYDNCIAVPYIPYDEDYGYITIEAMQHKKPVVTLKDSGGPTELIVDGKTGFVVSDFSDLTAKLDFYAENVNIAIMHGNNAFNNIEHYQWPRCLEMLLNPNCTDFDDLATPVGFRSNNKKIQVTVTSTFGIYPPLGGGQVRIFNLYKHLTRDFEVALISSTSNKEPSLNALIAPGLSEYRVKRTQAFETASETLSQKAGAPVTDIAMLTLCDLTPEYGEQLKQSMEKSQIVIASHPYLYPKIKEYLRDDQILVFEAQDVEYKLKSTMLNNSDVSKKLLEQIYNVEQELCNKANIIMTCSDQDAETLCKLYGADKRKILTVPNGVDTEATTFTPITQRIYNKEKLGLSQQKIGIFMGSYHGPNLEACEKIMELAPLCPGTTFLLIGSQCWYYNGKKTPENVGLLGLITEEEKNRIFSIADFAVNPMLSGSGTNLKMFDYLAAGLPTITTSFGARGILDQSALIVRDIEQMSQTINQFQLETFNENVEKARKYMEDVFDWKVIAQILNIKLHEQITTINAK